MALVKVLTAPTVQPVTLADVKLNAVIEHNDDDVLVDSYIEAATKYIEAMTELSLVRRKLRMYFNSFCDEFELTGGPVQVIDQIQYVDIDGVTQTVSASDYTYEAEENIVRTAYGVTWPSSRYQSNAVWVDYWAGYYTQTSPESSIDLISDIPRPLRQAITMLASELYRNRESRNELQTFDNPVYGALASTYRQYK